MNLLNKDKYNIQELQEEANKYKTRNEFRKKSIVYYNYSKNKKLLNELFKNHDNEGYSINKHNHWIEETLQEESNKYQTRTEFKKENNLAYCAAKRLKILDTLFKKHLNNGYSNDRVRDGHWTKETLQKEANKYQTRNEFKTKNNSAYIISFRNNIIDELFKNHINNGYLDKKEWKENSYVIYVYELLEFNKAYVGLTNDIDRRDKEHVFNETELLNKFCKENNMPYPKYKILEEKLKSTDAKKQEEYWINYYKNNNWFMFNIAKSGSLGGYTTKWTKKALQKEADKYEYRIDFYKNNTHAYSAAARKKLLDELFKNHKNNGYSNNHVKYGYWNEEKIQEEANKYETRSEFREHNGSAYMTATKLKILNDIFKNHLNNGYSKDKKINGYWTEDKLQEEANKYTSIIDFYKNNTNAYSAAVRNKLLDELFKNHKNNGYSKDKKINGYWTEDKLKEEANKYKTRLEFKNEDFQAYSASKNKKMLDKLFENHLNKGYSKDRNINGYWTENRLQEEANKYKTINEFSIKNKKAWESARSKNILYKLFDDHKNKGHLENRVKYGYWTEDKLQEEANKYKNRNDFVKNNINAYSAAKKKKIINKLFKNHLNNGYIQKIKKN